MKLYTLLALSLLALPLNAQEVLNDKWFDGATKYKRTGEEITISWNPHVDNAAWQNNYVFDIEVVHYERNQTVINELAINNLSYSFSLDRTGHYIVKLRACEAGNTSVCSPWTNSWENSSNILLGTTTIDKWWVFVWLSPPTNPGVN